MDRILMVPILQNSVVALILLFLHYLWVSGKLKGGVVSGTYSGIGKRVEEAKGGSTGQVGKGTEIWDGSEGKQKRVKGCPTKNMTMSMNEKTIATISYIKWKNIGSSMNLTMKMHKGHACG